MASKQYISLFQRTNDVQTKNKKLSVGRAILAFNES